MSQNNHHGSTSEAKKYISYYFNNNFQDTYSQSSDSREQPEEAYVAVQLSLDLKLCCGVCPPHCVPVDWWKVEEAAFKNSFRKQKVVSFLHGHLTAYL